MPSRFSPKTISLSFGILVLLFSLSFIAFAWTEPTLLPPSGNADSPLNVGTTAQTKNARLSVTELYDANDSTYYLNPNGQSVLSGPLGIGITGPATPLHVSGASIAGGDSRFNLRLDDTAAFAAGVGAGIQFVGKIDAAGTLNGFASIKGIKENGTSGNPSGALSLITSSSTGANVERMRIDSAGNVGIGTTTPGSALDLNGALSIRAIAAPSVSPLSQGRIYFDSTANVFKVSENGGAYVNLVGGSSQWTTSGSNIYYNTGNVGIGTAAPTNKLSVGDDITAFAGGNAIVMGKTTANSAIGVGQSGTDFLSMQWNYNAIPANAYAEFYSGNHNIVFTPGTGKIGIGTTSPGMKLDILPGAGTETAFRIQSSGGVSDNFYIGQWGGTGSNWNLGGQNAGAMNLYINRNAAAGDVIIGATNGGANSNVLMIQGSTGNVGIGTTTPSSKLEIQGASSDVNVGIQRLLSTDAVAADKGGYITFGGKYTGSIPADWASIGGYKENAAAEYGGYLALGTRANGGSMSEKMRITSAGNVGIGTAIPSSKLTVIGDMKITSPPLGYRKPIVISNTGSAQTDYQVSVAIDTASLVTAAKMRSDCNDVRFTDSNGSTLLNYWLESGCNTASTKFWVKIPSIAAGGKTIYVYYGNSSASSGSSGANTFIAFDDFDDNSNTQWTSVAFSGSPATWTETNQRIQVVAPTVNNFDGLLYPLNTAVNNTIIEYNGQSTGTGGNLRQPGWAFYNSSTNFVSFHPYTNGNQLCTAGYGLGCDVGNGSGYANANNQIKVVNSGTKIETFVNGVSKSSITVTFAANGQFGLAFWGGGAASENQGWADNFRVRKYAATESTAGTPGTEENSSQSLPILFASNGGDIGIGTAIPSSKLTVAGIIETTSGGVKFPDGTTQTTAATAGGSGSIGEITLPLTNVFTMVNINDVETGKGVYADKTAKVGTVSGGDTWIWTALDANFSAIESQQPAEGSDSMYVLYKKINGKFKYVKLDLKNKTLTSLVDEIPELWYDDAGYPNHNADVVYQYVTLTHDGNYMISVVRSGNNGTQSNSYIVAEVRNKTTHASVKKAQSIFTSNRSDGRWFSFSQFYLGRNYATDSWVHYVFGTRHSNDINGWDTSSWIQYASVKWDGINLTFSAPGAGGGGGLWYGHDYYTAVQYSSKYPNEAMLYGVTDVYYNNSYTFGLYSRKVGDYANTVTTHYNVNNVSSSDGVSPMTSLSVNGNVAGATFGYRNNRNFWAAYTSFIFDEDFNVNAATPYSCSSGQNACTDTASVNLIPDGVFNGIYHTDSYSCNPACESAQTYSKREGKSIASGSGKKIKNEFMFASDSVNFKTSPSNLLINFGTTINYYGNRQTQWEWTIDTSKITSLSKAYTALGAALDKSYLYYNSQYYNNLSLNFDYYNGLSWVAGAEGSVDSLGFVPQKIRVNFDRGFSFNWPYLVFTYK